MDQERVLSHTIDHAADRRLSAKFRRMCFMDQYEENTEAQDSLDEDDDDSGQLERTDIDSDELLDGEVDAEGGSAISRRNT
jgi:hypothetical protein